MSAEAEPRFLDLETLMGLHRRSLELHGGLDGVRDAGAIESALSSAQNTWLYGGGDLHDIAESQAFLDGNKRTAVACALVFLATNGVAVPTDDGSFYRAMIAIARREFDKPGLAALLRRQFPKP